MSGWDSQMEALIKEAKDISDYDDGECFPSCDLIRCREFILKIAGLDGDPNYQ